ncbi:MAG: hypothetical protein JSW05_02525 [Candidatus Thorarchaeota archaeon]|nr:MAG: hypothetical protein JSW05_02525 [Candidatus Thorarchaeota archaeon]
MRKPDRKQLQVAVICIGVVIAVFGFSIHFVVPGETRSGYPITVEASSYVVDEIRFSPGTDDYSFRLYLRLNFLYQNLSAYLLSETEYERFSTGTPIGEVDTIANFAGSPDYEWETSPSGDINLRIVIFNNNTVRVFCGYYYVVIPATFSSSLTIAFAGLFVALAGLGWYLVGWRRYFILGLAVNLALFYVRVFTLVADVFAFSVLLEQTIEPYNDYLFFYLRWIPNLWEGAWPYTLDPTSMMSGYVYPPLWLYTVGLLGSIPSWLPGLILFSFNVATGAVVFGISHRLTHDEKRSVFAMTLFLLNPITLVYGSFLWLNPTPYVFVVTLSFYLAVKGRKSGSIIAMAMATLYKQFAVVFFPLLVLALVRQDRSVDLRRGVLAFVKHSTLYAAFVCLVSLPFLFVDSEAFIGRMFIGSPGPESLATFHPELGWPVNFNTFFTWVGVPDVIVWAIAYLLAYYVLLGLSLSL